MFLADSTGARRRVGAAIAAALDFYFPKREKLSLTSYLADRGYAKPYRDRANTLTTQKKYFFLRTWRTLRLCARQNLSDLFFIQSFRYLCVVFTALALASTTLAGR